MRTFVFTDDKSNKFWHIALRGTGFTVTFGKVGTKGQTQTKDFPDEAAARRAYDKLVAEKLGKGYVETTPAEEPPPSPLQQALEAALAENPDDLAAHSAYADYLMEQDDPRGEFIQMQLALEDPSRPAAERAKLQARADELQAEHARQWLGDAGRFLVGDWSGPDKPFHYEFRRGWPDLVRVLPSPEAAIAALARSPQARLLRRLEVVYDMRYHPFEFDQFLEGPAESLRGDEGSYSPDSGDNFEGLTVLPPLLTSPYLTNLRFFKLGFSDTAGQFAYSTMVGPFVNSHAGQVIELLGKNSRLEELYLNATLQGIESLFTSPKIGNVRVLQYYYGSTYFHGPDAENPYPLTALAGNASLRRLTTLRLHPGRGTSIDIDELDAILRSPNLPALAHLQIHVCSGDPGDEVCRRVVASGILRRLETLDIAYGQITDAGARLLADCPDLKRLASLDLSRNSLTPAGVAALEAAGVRVVADEQHAIDDEDFSYDVDME